MDKVNLPKTEETNARAEKILQNVFILPFIVSYLPMNEFVN